MDKEIKCNSVVIPNPISEKAVDEKNYIGRERSNKVIAVGRLCEQKNFELFIESVKLLISRNDEFRNYKFEIFGDGKDKEALSELICKNNLEGIVELKGIVDNAIALNNDAALYVMSSDFEGFPNTLVEAMANGIPCISTDFPSGAASELIGKNNERGMLVPTRDVNKMTDAIENMLFNKELSEKKAILALENVKKYNKKEICDLWLETLT